MPSLRIARSNQAASAYRTDFAELADQVREAKIALEVAEAHYRQANDELAALMSAKGSKTGAALLGDGVKYRITFVQAERLEINESGLRKAIGAVVFDKLCDLKLNRSKLELAVAEGRVDPAVVGLHSQRKLNRPSFRFSELTGFTPGVEDG